MNILHLRYVVEVEKTKSISKAAENLYMNQPNLSRAIKELEENLGILIFKRNSKGITVTLQGEELLIRAKKILQQIDEVELIYKNKDKVQQRFSISVPRVSYIGTAFTEFIQTLDAKEPLDISYKETNSMRAISNILQGDYQFGIVRYQSTFDGYFKKYFKEKNLEAKLLTKFHYVALMSKNSNLALKDEFMLEELKDYIEIAHADPYVPSLPFLTVKKAELLEYVNKRIFVFERASQMDLLSNMKNTFMWVSPIPKRILKQYNLVEMQNSNNKKEYQDVLICRKGHKITKVEQRFIDIVRKHANSIDERLKY
jgi:DNA-binding transcriptional LysR family regulator